MSTYFEQEQQACADYIALNQHLSSAEILQAVVDTINRHSDQELTALYDFLRQDPYMATNILGSDPTEYKTNILKAMDDVKQNESSTEVLIGTLYGWLLGLVVVPSNDYTDKYMAPFKILEKGYQLNPEKFNKSIASYRCVTYKALKQAQGQVSVILQKIKSTPHHSKMKLKDVKELYKVCGLPSLEEFNNNEDPNLSKKWALSSKFITIGFVGVLIIGGLTITGVFPMWIIGEVLAGSWSFLMTVANRLGQRIINSSADKEAAKTPTSLGYTPQNIDLMIQFVLQAKDQLSRELKRIGIDEEGYLYDENGEELDPDDEYAAYQKKEYEYYKFNKCAEIAGRAIYGMAIACANIVDITRR